MSAALAQVPVPPVPVTVACRALGVARATLYRRRRPTPKPPQERRPAPPRALDADERARAVALLHNSERFVDRAPEQIVATLLDEGSYYARRARCTACSRPAAS